MVEPLRDEDLVFVPIRSGTDQWSVRLRSESGEEVAVVTERVIATPTYSVRLVSRGREVLCADRDAAVEAILDALKLHLCVESAHGWAKSACGAPISPYDGWGKGETPEASGYTSEREKVTCTACLSRA